MVKIVFNISEPCKEKLPLLKDTQSLQFVCIYVTFYKFPLHLETHGLFRNFYSSSQGSAFLWTLGSHISQAPQTTTMSMELKSVGTLLVGEFAHKCKQFVLLNILT